MSAFVDELQACEVDALTEVEGISVEVERIDNQGFPRVRVDGPTPEAVVEYVRAEWGDEEDPEWFAEYVVGRVIVLSPVDDGPADNWGGW